MLCLLSINKDSRTYRYERVNIKRQNKKFPLGQTQNVIESHLHLNIKQYSGQIMRSDSGLNRAIQLVDRLSGKFTKSTDNTLS